MDVINNDIEYDINTEEEDNGRRPNGRSRRREDRSWDQYMYTIAMFFNHFAYGVNFSIIGPTLVDLKYMFNTSMNLISISMIFGNVGYLSGSLFGLLYKHLNRQMTLAILLFGMSASVAMIPFCPSLWWFYLCSFVNNLGAGAWDNGNNVWLVEMWPSKSSAVLQFSQFMYGLGSVLAPVLVKPYLTGENSTHSIASHALLNDMTPGPNTPTPDRRELLKTPFLIVGGIQGLIPMVLLIMFFTNRYKNSSEKKLKRKDSNECLISDADQQDSDLISVQSDSPHVMIYSRRTEILLITLFSLFVGIYATLEIAHFTYSSTYYQFIALKISAQNAAEILSVMCTSYTVGRGLSAFIAIRISPRVMIIYHLLIIMTAMAVLYYGQHSLTLIWIGNIIIGFGFSAMYPAIIAMTAAHIQLTDTVSTVLVFTNGIVGMVTPFILGPLIENNPFSFIELEIVYLIVSVLLFLSIVIIIERTATSGHTEQQLL